MNLEALPSDALYNIFMDLPIQSINSFCRSNKRFEYLCQDEVLWRSKYLKEFGSLPQKSYKEAFMEKVSRFYIVTITSYAQVSSDKPILGKFIVKASSEDDIWDYLFNEYNNKTKMGNHIGQVVDKVLQSLNRRLTTGTELKQFIYTISNGPLGRALKIRGLQSYVTINPIDFVDLV